MPHKAACQKAYGCQCSNCTRPVTRSENLVWLFKKLACVANGEKQLANIGRTTAQELLAHIAQLEAAVFGYEMLQKHGDAWLKEELKRNGQLEASQPTAVLEQVKQAVELGHCPNCMTPCPQCVEAHRIADTGACAPKPQSDEGLLKKVEWAFTIFWSNNPAKNLEACVDQLKQSILREVAYPGCFECGSPYPNHNAGCAVASTAALSRQAPVPTSGAVEVATQIAEYFGDAGFIYETNSEQCAAEKHIAAIIQQATDSHYAAGHAAGLSQGFVDGARAEKRQMEMSPTQPPAAEAFIFGQSEDVSTMWYVKRPSTPWADPDNLIIWLGSEGDVEIVCQVMNRLSGVPPAADGKLREALEVCADELKDQAKYHDREFDRLARGHRRLAHMTLAANCRFALKKVDAALAQPASGGGAI